tara:strand:+ start:1096 stop:1347 length:252 start_codon:yes stop_codon:yes gene_type:complete
MSVHKRAGAKVMTFNNPLIVAKRATIEAMLVKLSNARDSKQSNTVANQIRKEMNDLKRMNRALQRKHVAVLTTRQVRVRNTKM